MKKSIIIGISIWVVFIISLLVSFIVINILYGWHMYVASQIEIHIPFAVKNDNKDSHGGVQREGESLSKFYFDEKNAVKFKEKINKNQHWKKLPMTKIVEESTGAWDKEMKIPEVKNGYWFYLDRHSEATDKYNENDMYNGRYSFNYSVAVYDTDENILYFYELDT